MNILQPLLQALPITLLLWLGAQALGLALAIPVAAARMSRVRILRIVAIWWIEIFRGIPTLVLLFVVFFGLSLGSFHPSTMLAGILALGFSSSGYLAESIRAGFEAVPRQQREAAMALSLPLHTRLGRVLLPQAMPIITEGIVSYSIHLFKETALASLIGLIDMMAVAYYLVERGMDGTVVFAIVGTIYLVGCLILAYAAHLVGKLGKAPRSTPRRSAMQKAQVA